MAQTGRGRLLVAAFGRTGQSGASRSLGSLRRRVGGSPWSLDGQAVIEALRRRDRCRHRCGLARTGPVQVLLSAGRSHPGGVPVVRPIA